MKPLEPLQIQSLLNQFHLRPRKGLGQNFLMDEAILSAIAEKAGITETSSVLEIGPGLGSLTRHLASRAARVTAVELDKGMIPVLEQVLQDFSNVKIVQGDILNFSPEALGLTDGFQVVANIPYYITSAVVRHLLSATVKPADVTLTIQKEVAERICARPGDLSLLALSVQIYGTPELLFPIPAVAFYPPPKVDSALLRIRLFAEPLVAERHLDPFFRLARAGFGQKRKTLRNALASNLGVGTHKSEALLSQAGIDPMRRAETLAIAEWLNLMTVYEDERE